MVGQARDVARELASGGREIRRALERYPSFRERCFTEAERAYCESRRNPAESFAGRFAGKEAVGKALGFGVARAFAWKEVEIVGRPLANIMMQKAKGANATVTVAHTATKDLGAVTRQAEILLVAAGKAEVVPGDMIKPGAGVIDVGVNRRG